MVALADTEYGTPEWVAARRQGLGASDLPSVLGLDPYRTEHELWELKTGRVAEFTGNAKTRWGHRLEKVGMLVWHAEHNSEYHPPLTLLVATKPQWPHLWASPDGIADHFEYHRRIGVEVKVTSAWVHPPERVKVQALVQMGLADLERVDIVRLSFDDDPVIFRIERDEQAIADILAAGEAWWQRHIIEGVEPPRRPDEAPADERQVALAADLRRVRKAKEQLERQESAIRDDLIASVAGQGVITGPGFRVKVSRVSGSTRTSWKDVAEMFIATHVEDADRDAFLSEYQTTSGPSTRLEAHWNDEEA